MRFEMADEPTVILQVFEEKFLASEQGIRGIHNHTDVSVLDVNLVVLVQGRSLATDARAYFGDHSTHRLNPSLRT